MKKEAKKVRGVFEKLPGSGEWWIRFADSLGKYHREKAGSKSAAIKLYQRRKSEALEGKKLPETLRAFVRVADLAEAVRRDYTINGKKSLDSLERRLTKHLLPFFGSRTANDLATTDIDRYVDQRKTEGAENATINRELAVLKRMYRLALRSSPPRVHHVPPMPRLRESFPRTGFVEETQYNKLAKHATEGWLGALVLTAYTYGFRKGELLSLRVGQVDLLNKRIRLDAGATKNNEGRSVAMTPEVCLKLSGCVDGKQPDDCVFTRGDNEPILDFRGSWFNLCESADLGRFVKSDGRSVWKGLVFHDLRRSAVRNMVRRGVPELVAMKISGHKTRSVFDRYNIINEDDIDDAAVKIAAGRVRDAENSTDTPAAPRSIVIHHARERNRQEVQSLQ